MKKFIIAFILLTCIVLNVDSSNSVHASTNYTVDQVSIDSSVWQYKKSSTSTSSMYVVLKNVQYTVVYY